MDAMLGAYYNARFKIQSDQQWEWCMNRRSTLKYLAAGGLITAFGGGYHWLSKVRAHPHLALDLTIDRLSSLDLDTIVTTGEWEMARTFDHLAQSIEFSMAGYPELKPKLFQKTVGKLAFSVFQANGRMKHGLDEKIPGEVVVVSNSSATEARERLLESMIKFDSFGDSLHPHFAYGELNKTQYALAHVMHVNNHLEEFRIT